MPTFAPKGNIHGPILPEFVLKKSITAGAKLLYTILCNYAAEKDHCWPSQARLAERLSCSVSSIKNYLAELVREKLITVRKEQYRSSVYYMIRPENLTAGRKTHSAPQQAKVVRKGPNSGYLNNFRKQEKEKTPPLPPIEQMPVKPAPTVNTPAAGRVSFSLPDFESIWELYPKKEAKGFARVAWVKLQRCGQLPPLQTIRSCIEQSITSEDWQREHGRYVPQLSNWLRGHRWLDESSKAPDIDSERTRYLSECLTAQDEKRREKARSDAEKLRPVFERFLSRFTDAKPMRGPAWGLWSLLHSKGKAPLAEHVPQDNALGVMKFLQTVAA